MNDISAPIKGTLESPLSPFHHMGIHNQKTPSMNQEGISDTIFTGTLTLDDPAFRTVGDTFQEGSDGRGSIKSFSPTEGSD